MLLDREDVYARIDDNGLVLVDLRAEAEYRKSHIRGALHLPAHAMNDPESPRASLWPVDVLRANLEAAGIGDAGILVAYDDSGLVPSAKLFWVLEYLGRSNVAVLDGGFAGWKQAGLPVEHGESGLALNKPAPGLLSSPSNEFLHARRGDVLATIGSTDTVIVDARTADEFAGRSQTAARDGHIPGAVNLNWEEHIVDLLNPAVRPLDQLRELYLQRGVTPDKQIITYCRSGARSSHTYFVLRLLGYPRVRNYAASWLEWGNDPDTPVVATGERRNNEI